MIPPHLLCTLLQASLMATTWLLLVFVCIAFKQTRWDIILHYLKIARQIWQPHWDLYLVTRVSLNALQKYIMHRFPGSLERVKTQGACSWFSPREWFICCDNLSQTWMCSWELFPFPITPRCRKLLSMSHMLGNTEALSGALAQPPGVNSPDVNTQISTPAGLFLTLQLYDLILLLMNEKERYFI